MSFRGDYDFPSRIARPRGVKITLDRPIVSALSIWIRPSMSASSHTGFLGHVLAHASLASAYVRGRLAIHVRNSKVSSVTGSCIASFRIRRCKRESILVPSYAASNLVECGKCVWRSRNLSRPGRNAGTLYSSLCTLIYIYSVAAA